MCGNFINPSNSGFLGGPVGKTAAAIALSAIAGPEIGAALGASGIGAGALGSGIIGAGLGATGGGGLKGAAIGGAGGAAGGALANGGLDAISDGISGAAGDAGAAAPVISSGADNLAGGSGADALTSGDNALSLDTAGLANSGGDAATDTGTQGGALNNIFNPSAASTGAANTSLDTSGLNDLANSNAAGTAAGTGAASSGSAATKGISTALQVMKALNAFANPNQTSQKQVLANEAAAQAKNDQYSSGLISSLQNANLNRTQTAPMNTNSYYTYGQNPEHQFFSQSQPLLKFASGGSVPDQEEGGFSNKGNTAGYNPAQYGATLHGGIVPALRNGYNPIPVNPLIGGGNKPLMHALPPQFANTAKAIPGFASGGSVDPSDAMGALAAMGGGDDPSMGSAAPPSDPGDPSAGQGALGSAVPGADGGQDDTIPAQLSSGEFVMPADAVSGLGDGNNAAGAKKMHALVKGVRKHKTSKKMGLPPKAKSPAAYMKGMA